VAIASDPYRADAPSLEITSIGVNVSNCVRFASSVPVSVPSV
jgi:hypothetical protein